MLRYDRAIQLLAACLSGVAGYVDALGFLKLGGFFVSFMSGNSTRLAVGFATRERSAEIAGALIATFVSGVVLGSLVGSAARERRPKAVLALVAFLLGAAAILSAFNATPLAIGAMVLAMGAENAVFERDGEVSIGLTYMTGALVKLGQRISGAFLGKDPLAWTPYFLLWTGLVAGAILGALVYPRLGLQALWIAAAAVAVLSIVAGRITASEPPRSAVPRQ